MRAAIFTIPDVAVGRLSIMARPRGGDWLADEMRALRDVGVDALVSLLTYDEIAELDLLHEPELCIAAGMRYLTLPIPDRAVPTDNAQTYDFVAQLAHLLSEDAHITIHCRQGIGRATIIAAAVMVFSGVAANDALTCITTARGHPVPDTREQREWVEDFTCRFHRNG